MLLLRLKQISKVIWNGSEKKDHIFDSPRSYKKTCYRYQPCALDLIPMLESVHQAESIWVLHVDAKDVSKKNIDFISEINTKYQE